LLKFPYQNYHELPRIENLTLHTTVGQSLTGSPANELKNFHEFTGQRPSLTQARKANASFGIRKGERIGCKISFRHKEWQNFVNRHFICCGSTIAKMPKQTSGNSPVGRVGIRSDGSPQTSFGSKRSKVQSISFGLHADRHLSGMEANLRMRIPRRAFQEEKTVFVCRRTEALLFLYSASAIC